MVNKVLSEDYIDLLVDSKATDFYQQSGVEVIPINNEHSMVNIPADINEKCLFGKYPYNIFPTIYTLESVISLEDTGVLKVRNTPDLSLTGDGVLVGIIDTGIEFDHDAFINENGTSRIVSIWDQTINNGTVPPEGFTYGTEFTKELLNSALASLFPLSIVPTKDEIGHGTMVAGIIAGNVEESANFSGVAPKSELVVVKLKQAKNINKAIFMISPDKICYQDTDIMLGIRYVVSVAEKLSRPLALCIALGTGQGGHDGQGAASTYLSSVALTPQYGVVISAGNEGIARRHYFTKFEARQQIKNFELNVSYKDKGFSMELWGKSPNRLSIDITTPSGEYYQPIPPSIGECRKFIIPESSSIIWVNNALVEGDTGDPFIVIRFKNPINGVWKFGVHNIDNLQSEFHVWLPSGDLITNDTYLLDSDPNTTITSPGNAIEPLTVTAYNGSDQTIAANASRGYTRSNYIKPGLAAPGVDLTCPTLNNTYGMVSGTGAAAALATGIKALILEWAVTKGNFTTITGFDIKKLLIRSAERSPYIEYPNTIWGYGKIDINKFFENLK